MEAQTVYGMRTTERGRGELGQETSALKVSVWKYFSFCEIKGENDFDQSYTLCKMCMFPSRDRELPSELHKNIRKGETSYKAHHNFCLEGFMPTSSG